MSNNDMLSEKEFNAKLAKAREASQRQHKKNLEKLNDPEYKKIQIEKCKARKERAIEKQRAKLNSPEFRASQIEKAKKSALKQSQRALEKLKVSKNPPTHKLVKSKRIKRRSPKGRPPTTEEKRIGNLIAGLGCICCRNAGYYVPNEEDVTLMVSLHHIDGRVKKHCHLKVIPLCGFHHQVHPEEHHNIPVNVFPIHGGGKKRWIEVNGTEEELLEQVYELIGEKRPWLNEH